MQVQTPNLHATETTADNSIAGLFIGSGVSMFGFLLLIVLLA